MKHVYLAALACLPLFAAADDDISKVNGSIDVGDRASVDRCIQSTGVHVIDAKAIRFTGEEPSDVEK